MSISIWTDGNAYSRATRLIWDGQSGLTVSGLPDGVSLANSTEIFVKGAVDRKGSAINPQYIGLSITSWTQKIDTSLIGSRFTASASRGYTTAIRGDAGIEWTPDNTGGSITFGIDSTATSARGLFPLGWAICTQTNAGSTSGDIYGQGSLSTGGDITLSGAYLGDGGNLRVTKYMIVPLVSKPVVTFDSQGGYLSDAEKIRFVAVGAPLGTLPTPRRTGYLFLGWFTEAAGGTQVTADTVMPSEASVTYYAHWANESVIVILDATGGTVSPPALSLTINESYGTLPTPSRAQHNFVGWYSSDGAQITAATIVTNGETHTLTAQWISNPQPLDQGLLYDPATGRLIYDDYMLPPH